MARYARCTTRDFNAWSRFPTDVWLPTIERSGPKHRSPTAKPDTRLHSSAAVKGQARLKHSSGRRG
jgi:hypothetical protein